MKKRQQAIVGFLEANRISFEEVDITMQEDQRLWMYQNIPEEKRPVKGNPLPPQIFSGDHYCGVSHQYFSLERIHMLDTSNTGQVMHPLLLKHVHLTCSIIFYQKLMYYYTLAYWLYLHQYTTYLNSCVFIGSVRCMGYSAEVILCFSQTLKSMISWKLSVWPMSPHWVSLRRCLLKINTCKQRSMV